jgi:glutamate synthase domain-containing protein 2
MVATYLLFVAEEVRRHLATLGVRSVDDAIGRVDLLRPLAHAVRAVFR